MIDGYNSAIVSFNEKAVAKIAMEEEMERIEAETAVAWVMRFKDKFDRWPNPNYFRYEKKNLEQNRPSSHSGSRSPHGGKRVIGSGHLPSHASIQLHNQQEKLTKAQSVPDKKDDEE